MVLFSLPGYNGGPAMFDLVGRDEGQLQRTLFGIVSGCLSTIILCAWTAAHPNVPPRSTWKARWNRLKLMFWMIVTPELVVAWAVRQYFAAKDIRDTYNSSRIPPWSRWTLAHGHLLGMGGITLVSPELRTASPENQNGQVLSLNRFRELIRLEDFHNLLDIPEIDIRQSKGDDVLFAILQTSWFIIQCIARGQQRLALTELELVTLALASVHVATFAIWWHKPLGVQEPVRIYWRRERDSESRHVESAARHGHSSRTLSFQSAEQGQTSSFQPAAEQGHPSWSFGVSFGDVTRGIWRFVNNFAFFMLKNPLYLIIGIPIAFTYIISFPFFLLFPLGIISLLKILETQLFHGLLALIVPSFQTLRYGLGLAFMDLGGWLEVIFRGENFLPTLFGWYFLLPPLFLLLFLFTLFLTPLVLIFFILTSVKTSIHHAFKEGDRWSRMVFALSGVIIGGLHCIAWNFDYPTNSVQLVWQISSFFITVIPAIALVEPFTPRVSTTVLFSYILVRLFLIVQAIALLRKQPSSAFAAVDWTKYVPHLFPQ